MNKCNPCYHKNMRLISKCPLYIPSFQFLVFAASPQRSTYVIYIGSMLQLPPLSMYMQEHPSSVCFLCAPLSQRINVITCLRVSLTLRYFFNTPVSGSVAAKQTFSSPFVLIWSHFIWTQKKKNYRKYPPICAHTLSLAFSCSLPLSFFTPNPPQARAEELLLGGRALWSHMHPGLSWAHTSPTLKPLKAHAPARSHGSL